MTRLPSAKTRTPKIGAAFATWITAAMLLAPSQALAAGPTVNFTLPAENAMPSPLGAIPIPSDLYFDQGEKGDGDGTLLNSGSNIGISAVAFNANFSPAIERGLDAQRGWGQATGCHFFFSGAIDAASLPASPALTPSASDSVFLINLTTGGVLPVKFGVDVDTRVANVLAVVPVPGTVLEPDEEYACVVTSSVTGGAMAVVPSADFIDARDRTSANSDANDIYGDAADAVVAFGGGLVRADIVGMAPFTTMDGNAELVAIQTTVLPGLALPTADFAYTPNDWVFETPAELDAVFGQLPHDDVAIMATGYFDSPRFQTHDPNGNGKIEDLPDLGNLANPCTFACEPDDESFVDVAPADGLPDIQSTPKIPFTVTIPAGTPPAGGWPIIINQHGLGGGRSIVPLFADAFAEAGYASIGIDAVGHGYRFHDPNGSVPTNGLGADAESNFFGGTLVPDSFADQGLLGQLPLSTASTQVGFFQSFTNLLGVRDNFRQTATDLMQVVRLIQSNSIDSALSTSIDENNIFYMGHSLGGLMGAVLAPYEPDIRGYLLNAPGGGLFPQLFLNSSIGAGAIGVLNILFGTDPANVFDDLALMANLAQTAMEAGDPLTKSPHWIGAPVVGGARNVIMVIDHQDEVVPNQANEALAHAAGFELFQPYVANPMISDLTFTTTAGSGTVSGNGPGGVTAAVVQSGPSAHAASVFPEGLTATALTTLNFVPEHAHTAEWGVDGSTAFPSLDRRIRIKGESALTAALNWFDSITSSGAGGTFTWAPTQNPNPRENQYLAGGAETVTFFDRAVDGIPAADSTPNVIVDFSANTDAGRLTGARSTLGGTIFGNNNDMPTGLKILSTGVLPVFTALQKSGAGSFTADVTIQYTAAELSSAGIADGSLDEGNMTVIRAGGPGTCLFSAAICTDNADCPQDDACVEVLASTVDTALNEITVSGLTDFSVFGIVDLVNVAPPTRVPGGGSIKKDCGAEWLIQHPAQLNDVDGKGRPTIKQTCTQGDPACDFDFDSTQCTFRLGVCYLVEDDRLPDCNIDDVTIEEWEVKKPSEKDAVNPKKPKADLNRAELLRVPDLLTLPGTTNDNCMPIDIQVPLKDGTKKGKRVLKTFATGTDIITVNPFKAKKFKDANKMKLTCEP
jgi:pimeloyl-ACP methyl ester carboxylesterase